MTTYESSFSLPIGNRSQMRRSLIECFLNEKSGTGIGDRASRYKYYVDSFNEYSIFLKRPTQLNKGFDFTVNISGIYFKKKRRYQNPSHQDIFDALHCCKQLYPVEYFRVSDAIQAIYQCQDIDISNINVFFLDYENTHHPIQIILLAIKWLFMEQDCAYWNYSGRQMLYEGLCQAGLL